MTVFAVGILDEVNGCEDDNEGGEEDGDGAQGELGLSALAEEAFAGSDDSGGRVCDGCHDEV